jgi:glucose-1-phosphate cytidylyltransferase
MKAVILAGGLGTRLAEETEVRPKPMVEIGGQPILWHILKHFASYGVREFVIALGYKSEVIKRYFREYCVLAGNMTVDVRTGEAHHHQRDADDWTVHLIDTGMNTLTGGRVARLKPLLCEGPFLLTYGDGVADVDVKELIAFHRAQGKRATVTAVRPPARFGELSFDGDSVTAFLEKAQTREGWINGGFMVLEPSVFEYLKGDDAILEVHALERLAKEGQLAGYKHPGFWQCMDTLRDKRLLEQIWQEERAPWKTWK